MAAPRVDPVSGFGTGDPGGVVARRSPMIPSLAGTPDPMNPSPRVPPTAMPVKPAEMLGAGALPPEGQPQQPQYEFLGGGPFQVNDQPDRAVLRAPDLIDNAGQIIDNGLPEWPETPYSSGAWGMPGTEQNPNTGINGGGGPGTTVAFGPGSNWGDGGQTIAAYFASRGLNDPGTTAYWAGKWNEWGRNDPQYFWDRIQYEDKLIGGPQNSPWQELSGPGGGTGPAAVTAGGPNSSLYDEMLAKLINANGITPFGQTIRDQLMALMASGGQTPAVERRLQQARADVGNAFQGQLGDVRDALAGRGLLGGPGITTGIEGDALSRLASDLAPGYARAVTDIETHAVDEANENVRTAFALASGLSQDEAQNILQAIGVGTDREKMFAEVALQNLSENRQWNQFLATLGLSREQLANEIQQGDISNMIRLLEIWMNGAAISTGGSVEQPED